MFPKTALWIETLQIRYSRHRIFGTIEMVQLAQFSPEQIEVLNSSTAIAEELVNEHYKMSASQWLHSLYDIRTLANLKPEEIVEGPYAQIIRYEGKRRDDLLGLSSFDFYKICIQDHAILATVNREPRILLFPFTLYIVAHELIHVVRFKKFLQNFSASAQEVLDEEKRVHAFTREILSGVRIPGLEEVLEYYRNWHAPIEDLKGRM